MLKTILLAFFFTNSFKETFIFNGNEVANIKESKICQKLIILKN